MVGIITTGSYPKALWPGVKDWFGREYESHPTLYTDLFDVTQSTRAYEEEVMAPGFGLAPVKPQGAPVAYDSESQGYIARYVHVAYALGYIVTHEEMADNLYMKVSKLRASELARSMRVTREVIGANVYNRGFDSNYKGGDGVPLFSDAHPTLFGNQSNKLTVAADLSETSIEDICIQIMQARDFRGKQIMLAPKSLHYHPNNAFNAIRILKSAQQNDTANNAVNALRTMGLFSDGGKANNFFTDLNAWFVRTNCPNGMVHMEREIGDFEKDNDFDTKNFKASKYERYSFYWSDWHGAYGAEGA